MDGDEIRVGDESIQAYQFHSQAFRLQRAQDGVVGKDTHFKGLCPFGHGAADTSHADNSQGLSGQFRAHEFLPVPPAFFHGAVGMRNIAAQAQHERKGMFTGGNGIPARGIHHHDTFFGRCILVHIVRAYACPADNLQPGGVLQNRCGHFRGAADDQTIVIIDDSRKFLLLLRGLDIGFNAGLAE